MHKEIIFVFHRLSAIDQDEGPSGKIVYSIIEDASGLLDIRADTGEIIFARCLEISACEKILSSKKYEVRKSTKSKNQKHHKNGIVYFFQRFPNLPE